MKKAADFFILFFIIVFLFIFVAACKEKEISPQELAVGNWIQSKNNVYILWVTNPKGEWNSSVKIPDVTGKIVKSRGTAKGTWHIEEGQMIISVTESDVEKIWEKNATTFFDIVELTDKTMQLKEESGLIVAWNKTNTEKVSDSKNVNNLIAMGPVVVNLNKNRSHDKDRYLCLNMNLVLQEIMPEQEIPSIHPKAREAMIIFLSSLVFDDVKDFKSIKKQNKNMRDLLNPYMEGSIKEIKIEHIIVTTDIDQVEEFLIKHTVDIETSVEEGEETPPDEDGKNKES